VVAGGGAFQVACRPSAGSALWRGKWPHERVAERRWAV
jgi:hypothetical protein